MTGEMSIAGVFVHPLLVAACIALPLAEIAGRLLARAGFYRFVWHRGLFDVAMTVTIWVALSSLIAGTPIPLPSLV
jgi:hypothetical protein